MLFAMIGFLRDHIEAEAAGVAAEVNEFLGQWEAGPKVAGALRGKSGKKIGHLVLIEADSFAAAEEYFARAPYMKESLYARTAISEFAIEVGVLD
jgi:YCII-related domain